jgi:hypothetical protein
MITWLKGLFVRRSKDPQVPKERAVTEDEFIAEMVARAYFSNNVVIGIIDKDGKATIHEVPPEPTPDERLHGEN